MIRDTLNHLSQGNGARRHRPDYLIMLFVGVLMLLGLVVIYSISPALTARINAAGNSLDQNHFMYRQVAYLSIGLVAFAIASVVPLGFWRKHQGKILLGAIGLALVPIVFASTPIALCTNGACRWIDLGFTTAQPAEAIKLALVIFLSGFLVKRIQENKLNDVNETLLPLGIMLFVVSVIVIGMQKDLGTGLAIFGIVISILFVAGLNKKYFLVALGGLFALGFIFVISSAHRLERIATFINSADNMDSTSYHINQALIAIGSGGLTGKGLGQSIQAFGYLPEAANDSIFAIVAEKFGFLGIVVILAVFAALFLRLLKVMDHSVDDYLKLLIAGVFGWVFTHAVINIGSMLGIFPLTGITLPFLSFGGTSLLFIMFALGIAFQVSRYTTHQKKHDSEEGGLRHEDSRRRRGLGRTRYAGTSSN